MKMVQIQNAVGASAMSLIDAAVPSCDGYAPTGL
jgi:hypothetical protein